MLPGLRAKCAVLLPYFATSITPGLDDLIEAFPVVRKLWLPPRHARRRRSRRHRECDLLHVFLANDDLGQGFREQRKMQRGSPADSTRERIHQLGERNCVTVGGEQDPSDVSCFGCSEQGRGGIDLMEVVLQGFARTGPVRPAETKGGAIGAYTAAG